MSIPVELDAEIRAAVHSRGHDDNLSWFAVEALAALLDRYRRDYNGGRPFKAPRGGVRLKVGRPMKTTPQP